jgi:hypothetical protein
MSVTYTITLTDAENKALGYVALSPEEWINNAVHDRCRIAIDEIVAAEVERITTAGGTLSGTKEDIVITAPIKSALEQHLDASRSALERNIETNRPV